MKRSWSVRLHQVFKDMYAQKFTALFKSESEVDSWIELWSTMDGDVVAALARLPTEFPEWPPTFGQFKALLVDHSVVVRALPPPVKSLPTPEQVEKLNATIKKSPGGRWWTTEKVVNQAQVDFIIRQANHFGIGSAADKFLRDCREVGVITGNRVSV